MLRAPRRKAPTLKEDAMRVGAVVIVIWLIIGAIAAGQRGYFDSSKSSCAKASDTIVTIIAGPLNYIGINPKITCAAPKPSK
jgi:hypothetical protein